MASRDREARSLVAACAVVFTVAVALYVANRDHGFVFDDHALVETNPRVHALDLRSAFTTPYWGHERNDGLYRPLTLSSFALDWRLGAGSPGWFHVVNDVLHGIVAVLVVLLAWATLRDLFTALAAGILFAAHPVHTEAVHWIAGRAELLAGVFVLACLLLALFPTPLHGRPALPRLVLLLATGLFAILSKEHGVLAFPSALLALALLAQPSVSVAGVPAFLRRNLVLIAGASVVLVTWVALRAAAVGHAVRPAPAQDNPLAAMDLPERIGAALAVGVRWIEHLLLPLSFSVDYGAPQPLAGSVPVGLGACVTVLVLAALLVAVFLSRRSRPARAFWCAFVLVTYLPTSNLLFAIGTPFAERLLYLPSVGVCVLLAAGLAAIPRRSVAIGLLVLVAAVGSALTLRRAADWRDDRALFEHEIAHPPYSARAVANLAHVVEDDDPARAERLYREAQGLAPDFIGLHLPYGTFLLKRGDVREALRHLARADELYPDSPSTLLNLGTAYARLGRTAEAARCWERLVALEPENERARQNLDRLRRTSGR